jgi:hypothetical protein
MPGETRFGRRVLGEMLLMVDKAATYQYRAGGYLAAPRGRS